MTLDARFQTGCDHFNAAEYFEAHEVWEDMWVEAHGPRHAFLQGLIQIAVALHHAGNSNWAGTRKLLASGMAYLEKGKIDSKPVDIVKMKDHIVDFEIAVQKILAGEETALPFFQLPFLES